MIVNDMVNSCQHGYVESHLGGSTVIGVPQKRWMVFVRENPIEMDDDWGYPYDSGNLYICN